MIWGISSALHEATEIDARNARYVNDNLADYLVPVNADIQQLEVILVPEEDELRQSGGRQGHRRARQCRHRRGGRQCRLSRHRRARARNCRSGWRSCSSSKVRNGPQPNCYHVAHRSAFKGGADLRRVGIRGTDEPNRTSGALP